MTKELRKRLEDAMVASELEDLGNGDQVDTLSDWVENVMRHGRKGFAQMNDDELLNDAKLSVAYTPGPQAQIDDFAGAGIEAMMALIAVIREVDEG